MKNTCELQNKSRSNVLTNLDALQILFSIRGNAKAFARYKAALESSFAPEDKGKPENNSLGFIRNKIESNSAPTFIINTTVNLGKKELRSNKELKKPINKVYEITPFSGGNQALGYIDWNHDDPDTPTYSTSIASSGSPKFFGLVGIEGRIKNSHTGLNTKDLRMTDGGLTENLGVLGLIRRGIKNIIVVDASADPRYKFFDYFRLKEMLKTELALELSVPEVEAHKKRTGPLIGVSTGTVKSLYGERTISTIYYLKMGEPKRVLPNQFAFESKKRTSQNDVDRIKVIKIGDDLFKQRRAERCPSGEKTKEDRARCSCSQIQTRLDAKQDTLSDYYTSRVHNYSELINNPKFNNFPIWTKVNTFNGIGKTCYFIIGNLLSDACSLMTYNFPQTTTLDQSYFSDQFEAFVGLGYLQARKLPIEKRK